MRTSLGSGSCEDVRIACLMAGIFGCGGGLEFLFFAYDHLINAHVAATK